jgi:hypothetical protein
MEKLVKKRQGNNIMPNIIAAEWEVHSKSVEIANGSKYSIC